MQKLITFFSKLITRKVKKVDYKVLMYVPRKDERKMYKDEFFVDNFLLSKIITEANVPRLISKDATLESLIDNIRIFVPDEDEAHSKHIQNLRMCKLVEVQLIITQAK